MVDGRALVEELLASGLLVGLELVGVERAQLVYLPLFRLAFILSAQVLRGAVFGESVGAFDGGVDRDAGLLLHRAFNSGPFLLER